MSIFLSASSIKDFISCPQKVLYRFTKPFPEVPSKESTIGRIVHEVLEKEWESKERAYHLINERRKDNNLTKADNINLQFMVDLFFLNFSTLLTVDDLVEYKFKIPLYDDVFLVGKMDRISNGNIFDWKSGKVSKNLSYDVQCIIYDYAYRQIFNKPPSSICLASLSQGTLTPYRSNDKMEKEVFENIIPRMVKTVKNSSYERLGMFNHGCFRCQYKQGCLGENDVMADTEFIE